jgi:predicted alpha/beta superfamily hydrolase
MKKILLLIIFAFALQFTSAQVIYKKINSTNLNEIRKIKIQLPKNYDTNKSYPLIVVFDGDYLFDLVVGNVDYYSYWEDMPEAIVVGINQLDTRNDDSLYSLTNSLPMDNGLKFFEFVNQEVIPYMSKNYKTNIFKIAIGHGQTANFVNYFMLREKPAFQSYVVLSPELAPQMNTYIPDQLTATTDKTFYYLASGTKDKKGIATKTEVLNTAITAVDNKNVFYKSDTFEGATHYSLPAHAIPKALESIFFVFQPISKEEYKETILKLDTSPVDYLLEKYQTIEDLFGIKKPIAFNDFRAIAATINKSEKWEYFEVLGKLARKQYPETLLGHYYLGRFYEETGNTKKAMKTYQSAYILEEAAGITKDDVLELSDQIKADFGY